MMGNFLFEVGEHALVQTFEGISYEYVVLKRDWIRTYDGHYVPVYAVAYAAWPEDEWYMAGEGELEKMAA